MGNRRSLGSKDFSLWWCLPPLNVTNSFVERDLAILSSQDNNNNNNMSFGSRRDTTRAPQTAGYHYFWLSRAYKRSVSSVVILSSDCLSSQNQHLCWSDDASFAPQNNIEKWSSSLPSHISLHLKYTPTLLDLYIHAPLMKSLLKSSVKQHAGDQT